jgi:hypothetical protein
LFYKNIIKLLKKGIKLEALLSSEVFVTTVEFDEWPDVHTNNEDSIRPYHGNFFMIRFLYSSIFPENYLQPITSTIYKEHFL